MNELEQLLARHPGPFTIASSDPGDLAALDRFAPGKRRTLHYAGGVCLDVAKHIKGTPHVVDARGSRVPERDWQPMLRAARHGNDDRH